MKYPIQKNTKGFTIIEVMIVLAIAGLIMAIVFIAVPQLQRSQRNQARKDVMDRVKTEADNYASNNSGNVPTADNNATTGFSDAAPGGGFYIRYIKNNASQFNDPSTGAISTFSAWTSDANVTAGNNNTIWYATGRKCNGEATQGGTPRNYAVIDKLEGGALYCLDNS